jgi:hypothetical protein
MPDPSTNTAYMHCAHCGLAVRLRASFLTLDACPRCLARHRVARPMRITHLPEPPEITAARRNAPRPLPGRRHRAAHGLS